MIKLFEANDTIFTSNGDKIIIPLKAKVHKEDNGSFYLNEYARETRMKKIGQYLKYQKYCFDFK